MEQNSQTSHSENGDKSQIDKVLLFSNEVHTNSESSGLLDQNTIGTDEPHGSNLLNDDEISKLNQTGLYLSDMFENKKKLHKKIIVLSVKFFFFLQITDKSSSTDRKIVGACVDSVLKRKLICNATQTASSPSKQCKFNENVPQSAQRASELEILPALHLVKSQPMMAEKIVTSTQETTNNSFNVKLNGDEIQINDTSLLSSSEVHTNNESRSGNDDFASRVQHDHVNRQVEQHRIQKLPDKDGLKQKLGERELAAKKKRREEKVRCVNEKGNERKMQKSKTAKQKKKIVLPIEKYRDYGKTLNSF